MKIELTKDEWQFLKRSMLSSIEIFSSLFPDEYQKSQSYKFNEKLGSEWVDEECNATLPCGYQEECEPRFTYD